MKDGLFKKVDLSGVRLSVEFTEEEKEVIKQRDLKRLRILEVGPCDWMINKGLKHGASENNPAYDLLVEHLLPGRFKKETPVWERYYRRALHADNLEEKIREALPRLKAELDGEAAPKEGSDTFEL